MPLDSGLRTGVKQGTRRIAWAKASVSWFGEPLHRLRRSEGAEAALDGEQHEVAHGDAADAARAVAVSVDQIDFPTKEQPARLLVAVTEEQLKNAPDFMTREVVEAEEAAEQAQQQQQQAQGYGHPREWRVFRPVARQRRFG